MVLFFSKPTGLDKAILSELIPVGGQHPIEVWLPPMVELWRQVEYVFEWDACFFRLLSRGCKHGGPSARTQILPLISEVVDRCIFRLALPQGQICCIKHIDLKTCMSPGPTAIKKPDSQSVSTDASRVLVRDDGFSFNDHWMAKIASVIVLTFEQDNEAHHALSKFIKYVAPFFRSNSQNSGSITSKLVSFLEEMSKALLRRQDPEWQSKCGGVVPPVLSDESLESLIALLQPCIMAALDSDSTKVSRVVRNLAHLRPEQVCCVSTFSVPSFFCIFFSKPSPDKPCVMCRC